MEDKLKVIVVDDDDDDLFVAEETLTNCQVTPARSEEEALIKMAHNRFDVALVDYMLGPKSGAEVAARMQRMDREMAIVIHTGYPESFAGDIAAKFDGAVMKGADGEYLERYLLSVIEKRHLSAGERQRNRVLVIFDLLSHLIHDVHVELTSKGPQGISERIVGTLTGNNCKIAWVVYRLKEHLENSFTVGAATANGCGRGCKMCMYGNCPETYLLSNQEIMAQFIIAVLRSFYAQEFFRNYRYIESHLNLTGTGEPQANLDNVIKSIYQLTNLFNRRIKFILTSIGLEERLEIILDQHTDLPNVRHYWSVNAFREEVRHKIMPITRQHNFLAVRDLYQKIAEKTGEPITASIMLVPGLNDGLEEVEAAKKIIKGRPFVVKIQPFAGAPDFQPFVSATDDQLQAFQGRLEDAGIPCRIRHVIGGDCYSGCGTTDARKYRSRNK